MKSITEKRGRLYQLGLMSNFKSANSKNVRLTWDCTKADWVLTAGDLR